MASKLFVGLFVLLGVLIPQASAQAPLEPEVVLTSTSTIAAYITEKAVQANLEPSRVVRTLNCESRLNPEAVGDGGTSFGVAQIHLPAHPDVSKEEALNPKFSIDWTIEQWSLGRQEMWSCYKLLYGKEHS